MEKDNEKTKTIFRRFRTTGSIIAVFPELCYPKYANKNFIMSYMFIGQHSECDYNTVMRMTTLAKQDEYQALTAVLEDLGYNLEIVTKKEYENNKDNK